MSDGTGSNIDSPEGRKKYVAVRDRLGRATFDQLIREHERLWPMLQGMPEQYNKFLDDFFGYDAWKKEQEALEAQEVAA